MKAEKKENSSACGQVTNGTHQKVNSPGPTDLLIPELCQLNILLLNEHAIQLTDDLLSTYNTLNLSYIDGGINGLNYNSSNV